MNQMDLCEVYSDEYLSLQPSPDQYLARAMFCRALVLAYRYRHKKGAVCILYPYSISCNMFDQVVFPCKVEKIRCDWKVAHSMLGSELCDGWNRN